MLAQRGAHPPGVRGFNAIIELLHHDVFEFRGHFSQAEVRPQGGPLDQPNDQPDHEKLPLEVDFHAMTLHFNGHPSVFRTKAGAVDLPDRCRGERLFGKLGKEHFQRPLQVLLDDGAGHLEGETGRAIEQF
jgi:hypothetical protein